jgi:predicted small lipoprotein YifL
MTMRFAALMLALTLAGCGVKSDLMRPDGQPTAKHEKDPSKPPPQLGR